LLRVPLGRALIIKFNHLQCTDHDKHVALHVAHGRAAGTGILKTVLRVGIVVALARFSDQRFARLLLSSVFPGLRGPFSGASGETLLHYGYDRGPPAACFCYWLGPDDKIVIERYDDPRVANVSCYLSRAQTGRIKGGIGLAEDPSRCSIACRAVGPIAIPPNLPKSAVVGFSPASLFFKTFQIHRMYDAEKNVLIYTVVSTRLIKGSPFNSISVVPVSPR
jgi:CreA protein